MQQKVTRIRAKKLGILIYDARLASRRSAEECAQTLGITPEKFKQYEAGDISPSLPELESLAYYLKIPLDHFWGGQSLSEKQGRSITSDRLIPLRQRIIGALLRQARSKGNLSLKELAQKTGMNEEDIKAYELGEKPIPTPDLETLIASTNSHLDEFLDKNGPVGVWRAEQISVEKFLGLPTDLQEFVCKPVNRPYVELALRLSELSVERLRAIAEGLLEITY
jgi:transcriptional regulator with XRE-family HTH domain